MPYFIDNLPPGVQAIFDSDEYADFLVSLDRRYGLSDQQSDALLEVIVGLFRHSVMPGGLMAEIQRVISLSPDMVRQLARELMLNFVLLFPDFFGDQKSEYLALGGRIEDLDTAPLTAPLLAYYAEQLQEKAVEFDALDLEQERLNMLRVFARELAGIFGAPEGIYKTRLDNLVQELLKSVPGFEKELLQSLYGNREMIGRVSLKSVDGSAIEPTVENWLKDFLGFSGDSISNLAISRYLSASENARQLSDQQRSVLDKILNCYVTLKNFPASLANVPIEDWVIIPHERTLEEEIVQRAATPVPTGYTTSTSSIPTPPTPKTPTPPDPTTLQAENILAQVSLPQLDEQVRRRVVQGLVSRIKDIRDQYELKTYLIQGVDAGGPGFTEQDADAVVAAAESALNPKATTTSPRPAETATIPTEQTVVVPSMEAKADIRPIVKMPQTEASLPHVAEPLAPAPEKRTPPNLMIQEVDGVPILMERAAKTPVASPKPQVVESSAPTPANIPVTVEPETQSELVSSSQARASHLDEDVAVIPVVVGSPTPVSPHTMDLTAPSVTPQAIPTKATPPPLTDPIEELRTMSIVDFRRLNSDAYAATKRIYQMIQLLEKQSFTKRSEGIEAWHESEVGRLYAEMGVEIFGRGLLIDQVIAERKERGIPYLTAAEMDALMELNEMIRM